MKRLLALTLCLIPGLAFGQAAVRQDGAVVRGDALKWSNDHIVKDAGGLTGDNTGRGVNPYSILDSNGLGLCSNTAASTGQYNALCFGHDSSSNGLLSLDSYGGLGNKTFYFRKNGTLYEFPFAVGGAVTPATTTAGNGVVWNNSNGTLLADAGGQPVIAVPTNTALVNLTYTGGRVRRDGYTALNDHPPLNFIWQANSCVANGMSNDGGSCVDSAVLGSWKAQHPPGPLDARWWGVTYPFRLQVATTGNDSKWCFSGNPCATIQRAADVAAKLDFNHQSNYLDIANGTYAGATFSGMYAGTGGNGISGQYLYVNGTNGSGNVTVTNAPGQIYVFDVSDKAGVYFTKLTMSVGANQYGLFAQLSGTYAGLGDDVVVSSNAVGTIDAIYAETNAVIERPASSITNVVTGQFSCAMRANTGGYVHLDPGGTAAFSSGTGLTVTTGTVCAAAGGRVQWYAGSVTGAGVSGDPIVVRGNSTVIQQAGSANIPGNGYSRLENPGSFITAVGLPVLSPTLGTCTNGALAGANSNYSMEIDFTGANTTCAVVFGKIAGSTSAFSGIPRCFGSVNNGSNTAFISPASTTTNGVTFLPSAALANANALYVNCVPPAGG